VRHRILAAAVVAATAASGCGEYVRQGRSPAQLVIVSLGTAAIVDRELQGGTGVPGSIVPVSSFLTRPLNSDVDPPARDRGQVVLRQILRDPGAPGAPAAPTPLNDITVTEYDVRYRLANGRDTPGVDVPYPIRGGLTLTVLGTGTATAEFDLVRAVAKAEPPLAALKSNEVTLTVIADVTFYGRDQAGNAVSATGAVQINFADFR
jgi:hypothetical protein